MDTVLFSIEKVSQFSPEVSFGIKDLVKQLDKNYRDLSDNDIQYMLDASSNSLFIAKEKATGRIVGMITLIIYRIPYVKKGIIEDVVVHAEFRGKGIGSQLIKEAILLAKKEGASYVDLTSTPTKEEANRLYPQLGFQIRATNVYRLMI